jgi:addiction module HigA family antidote
MIEIVHPGMLIGPLILIPAGLSQSAFSRKLGFNQPQPVNELIKGKRGITPKMALLIEKATMGEYSAEFWLLIQLRWDLANARAALPDSRIALVERVNLDKTSTSMSRRQLKELRQDHSLKVSKQMQALG